LVLPGGGGFFFFFFDPKLHGVDSAICFWLIWVGRDKKGQGQRRGKDAGREKWEERLFEIKKKVKRHEKQSTPPLHHKLANRVLTKQNERRDDGNWTSSLGGSRKNDWR